MHKIFPPLAISIAIYYVLAFASELLHISIDPTGLKSHNILALTIAGTYNTIYFVFTGFLVTKLYKGTEKHIAAIAGLILVLINFVVFLMFPDDQPFVFRMLKVFIPLHAAMVGGVLGRKYLKKK
jgi:hypothetical protein